MKKSKNFNLFSELNKLLGILKNLLNYKMFWEFNSGQIFDICFYLNIRYFIMKISFFTKLIFFLALYCISDLSIKNNILKKVIRKAKKAKPVN